jgi:epoxyqueuosine reductase
VADPIFEPTKNKQDLKVALVEAARAQGFDRIGIVKPDQIAQAGDRLREFLALGRHGTMEWMERRVTWRSDPNALWGQARSIIMLGMNYGPQADPLAGLSHRDQGNISVYARSKDYHDVVKKRLKRIARALHRSQQCEVKVFVDTAPVMEKPLAQAAGLGWQGKHTNLVSPDFGSWLFLGAIFTDMDLPSDEPHDEQCGSCRACLDVCPTNAFPAPFQIDARRCISYLTIEHPGYIAVEFRQPMANRIYGCDDCLAVCPWNKFAQTSSQADLTAREKLAGPALAELAALDDGSFRSYFSGTPIKRTGRDRFVRNVLIAIGNSGDPELLTTAEGLLGDASELVRAMAVWAVSKLAAPEEFFRLREVHEGQEGDEQVLNEWRRSET